jgi:hypothetical protein
VQVRAFAGHGVHAPQPKLRVGRVRLPRAGHSTARSGRVGPRACYSRITRQAARR